MTTPVRHKVFNRSDRVVEGWYWALRSTDLARGEVKALNLMGKELAVYRGHDGRVVALDAHCPHMGAHLAKGRVEGNGLRCAFHGWKFDGEGRCVNVPCQAKPPPAQNNSWPVDERYGLIWIYTARLPRQPVPSLPELDRDEVDSTLGLSFQRKSHPNVTLLQAIDAQRFYAVHELTELAELETRTVNESYLTVRNKRRFPAATRFALSYSSSFWNGSTGFLTVGPEWLRFHLLFALRMGPNGGTEGQTVLLTKKRTGVLGWVINRLLLFATALLGAFLVKRDTELFDSMQFNLRMPVRADRAIIDFAQHVENQRVTRWGFGQLPETPQEQAQLPAAALAFRTAKPTLRN